MKGFNSPVVTVVLIFILMSLVFRVSPLIGGVIALAVIIYIVVRGRYTIYTIKGTSQYTKGNIEEALGSFEKAYNNGKCKAKVAISYAYLLLKSGRIDKAEETLNNILDMNLTEEERVSVKSNLALVLWKRGRLDEAIDTIEGEFEDHKNSIMYGTLGYFYILKGDLDKALNFNLEAYDYNSKDHVVLDNLGMIYYLGKDYEKAEEKYKELLDLNPTFPEAYYNYGLVLQGQNRLGEALEYVRKSLDYNMSFLTTLTKDDIEGKIREIEGLLNK